MNSRILFLHGWNSAPDGIKPRHLIAQGLDLIQPVLPNDDFDEALAVAQGEFDRHRPSVVVGSSRGGALAMNLNAETVPLVLLCPAWKRWGNAVSVKPGTLILHARADDVVPFDDSVDLLRASGLPDSALIVVGQDHRLSDSDSLNALYQAVKAQLDVARALGIPG